MLTLILIFAGSLILAVDPLTRHTIVLSGAQRSELQKCLNRFLEQRLQDKSKACPIVPSSAFTQYLPYYCL
jgi:hypothetical protein